MREQEAIPKKMRKVPIAREYARYHLLPKEFIESTQADELFNTYTILKQATHSSTYLFSAGSAAAESALVGLAASADERHHRLDCAEEAWLSAQYAFLDRHMWQKWSDARLYIQPNRIEMSKLFLPLYHDMVDRCVREDTISRVHFMLSKLAMENLEQHDIAIYENDFAYVGRRGLGYELGSLLAPNRLLCPSFFAIPAIARADNGNHYPEDTHDVRLIRQSWGVIEDVIQYEVKPNDKPKYDRYNSALIRGHVELVIPASTNPLDMALLAHREAKGIATPEEIAVLDDITSRVLRRADEFNRKLGTLAVS